MGDAAGVSSDPELLTRELLRVGIAKRLLLQAIEANPGAARKGFPFKFFVGWAFRYELMLEGWLVDTCPTFPGDPLFQPDKIQRRQWRKMWDALFEAKTLRVRRWTPGSFVLLFVKQPSVNYMCSTEEQKRQDKDTVGLVVDDNDVILFAVGDLRSTLASKTDPAEDDDDESLEPAGQDVNMRRPVDDRSFRGYRIVEPNEIPRGGKELYAIGEDHHFPEIALDLGPIDESHSRVAAHSEDFEMGSQVAKVFAQHGRHVSPGIDFYRPQPSRRLGDVRGDVPRTRLVVPAGGKRGLVAEHAAGYSQVPKGQDLQRRVPSNTTGGATSMHRSHSESQLAMALREEEQTRPVVKFREYRGSEGPVAGPSNEVFLSPEDVDAHHWQGSRRREDKRLEEEARFRDEARVKHRHFRG
jgi:hypothetical protein